MWSSQGRAEMASGGTASTSDTVMTLSSADTTMKYPENVKPKPDSILFQPSPCGKGIRPPTKSGSQIPFRLNGYGSKDTGLVQRSALAPVDGSPVAGALTMGQPFVPAADQRRRTADSGWVFDEFREERSRSRGMREQDTLHTAATAFTAARSTETELATAAQDFGAEAADVEMDDGEDVDHDPEKENTMQGPGLAATAPNPGALTGASGVAGLGIAGAWERAPLRDLVPEPPAEDQEDSDIESDGEDMPETNLAYELEERICQNTGNLYDFEIYCDP